MCVCANIYKGTHSCCVCSTFYIKWNEKKRETDKWIFSTIKCPNKRQNAADESLFCLSVMAINMRDNVLKCDAITHCCLFISWVCCWSLVLCTYVALCSYVPFLENLKMIIIIKRAHCMRLSVCGERSRVDSWFVRCLFSSSRVHAWSWPMPSEKNHI